MNQTQNIGGDSDTNSEKNDEVNEINDLKAQLDKNLYVIIKSEDMVTKNLRNKEDF